MQDTTTAVASAAPTATIYERLKRSPRWLMPLGVVLLAIALFTESFEVFKFSYLVAYSFFLSLTLGSLFLVIIHHLVDACWSTPLRRVTEHLSTLVVWMAIFFIPIAIFAPSMFPWMELEATHPDHALEAKKAYLNKVFWYIRSIIYFAVWTFLAMRLRGFSINQDKDGDPKWTKKSQFTAAYAIILFALSITGAAIDWHKSLVHEWFSTMYGVYYFASSVWVTLATLYLLQMALSREGAPLHGVLGRRQLHSNGVLLFAFTVFYAYIAFSQYFIIWNGNIPEETFWYKLREQGSWLGIGNLMIFGHFFAPFLTLLRIDIKMNPAVMTFIGVWAWLMHYLDMAFNIMPVIQPEGFSVSLSVIALFLTFAGLLISAFIKSLESTNAYPIKDPRLGEALRDG